MSSRVALDGAVLARADGTIVRVFDPPWWRIDRWARWLWWVVLGRPRGLVQVGTTREPARVVRVVVTGEKVAKVRRAGQ